MLAVQDSSRVTLRKTSNTTNQTVVIESSQSNFIVLVRSREAFFVPQTDIAARWFSESHQTMIASERVLAKDWDRPEEDAAWANL